ncbi:MAG: hypothetical protein EXS27_11745 [Pedosphaera sp.]|nr:hypothetical protein [Pedosphaera sp.]
MIETIIACQCGNRFKFGMDLVNGRAPDGLTCPSCGAPTTAACNALLDFFSGKEPAPPSAESRPVKEVKVTCACGARYKFDLELAEREMSSAVTCPGCQADLTPLANEEILNYPARHAPTLAAPSAAPSPAAAAATGMAVVSDPFGPAPTGKSGPNLKPMEVPKHVRPPPGTKPVAPPAGKASPAANPSAQKPVAKPAAASGQPNLVMGIVGGVVGSLIGAALWFALLKSTAATPIDPKSTAFTTTWMGIILGVLAGVGARLLGRTKNPALGGAACVCATLTIGVMAVQAMNTYIDRLMAPGLKAQYDIAFTNAGIAIKADDAELKIIIARNKPSTTMDATVKVTYEDVQAYRAKELPVLRDLAAGKPSREKWEAAKLSTMRAHYPFEDAWQESIGIIGLLFLLAGILAAAKIPMR